MRLIKHGKSRTRIYRIWIGMKRRCTNPSYHAYKDYGGMGIRVCEEWEHAFENFYEWAIRNGYSDSLTIERKDVLRGYSPQNCRWATVKEQSRNKKNTYRIDVDGSLIAAADAADIFGLNLSTIKKRLGRGWSVDKTLHTPTNIKFRRKDYYGI